MALIPPTSDLNRIYNKLNDHDTRLGNVEKHVGKLFDQIISPDNIKKGMVYKIDKLDRLADQMDDIKETNMKRAEPLIEEHKQNIVKIGHLEKDVNKICPCPWACPTCCQNRAFAQIQFRHWNL